jgi:hypothetical protein
MNFKIYIYDLYIPRFLYLFFFLTSPQIPLGTPENSLRHTARKLLSYKESDGLRNPHHLTLDDGQLGRHMQCNKTGME